MTVKIHGNSSCLYHAPCMCLDAECRMQNSTCRTWRRERCPARRAGLGKGVYHVASVIPDFDPCRLPPMYVVIPCRRVSQAHLPFPCLPLYHQQHSYSSIAYRASSSHTHKRYTPATHRRVESITPHLAHYPITDHRNLHIPATRLDNQVSRPAIVRPEGPEGWDPRVYSLSLP